MIGCIRAAIPYGPAVGPNTPRIRGAARRRAGKCCCAVQVRVNTATARRSPHHPPEALRSREEAMRRPGGIRPLKASRQFRGHRVDHWRGRSTAARVAILGLLASCVTALGVASSGTSPAQAASSCPAGGCAVTVDARDFASGSPLANFNFIINDDNSKPPSDPQALSTESYTPVVAQGDQDRATVNLKPGKYLITVRSLDHKMWGTYITLPDDAAADGTLTTRVDLTEASADHPLPSGKLKIFVFED